VLSSKQSSTIVLAAVIGMKNSPMMPLQAALYSVSLFNALWEEGGGRPLAPDGGVGDGGGHLWLVIGTAVKAAFPNMDGSVALMTSCIMMVCE
jgi:hypothetical protein